MAHAVLFGAGFTTVFMTMGLTATAIGAFLIGNLDLLQRVAGVLLIIFGLHMTGLLRLSWFYRERRVEMKHREAGVVRRGVDATCGRRGGRAGGRRVR